MHVWPQVDPHLLVLPGVPQLSLTPGGAGGEAAGEAGGEAGGGPFPVESSPLPLPRRRRIASLHFDDGSSCSCSPLCGGGGEGGGGGAPSEVLQLHGGIHRYLEAFPDGGFFRGKNLVFDGRRTVGPTRRDADSHQAVVGQCLKCAAAADSYEPPRRCASCRLLLLLCPGQELGLG